MSGEGSADVPLSSEAQDAKEMVQQQLLRKMAAKGMEAAIEEERQRRIKEGTGEEAGERQKAYNQLILVQEDLLRTMNSMRVKAEAELEQAQRVTQDKKVAVHEELLHKAAAKQADSDADKERERRIEESKEENSDLNVERRKTYDRLVAVQEDLLKTIQRMKVDEQVKQEQQTRVVAGQKQVVQEQLVKKISAKSADSAMEEERTRRVEGSLSETEIQRRVNIAHKMIDVQKELLATHQPVKAIHGVTSQSVLEEAKAHFQEQLLRKAAQREADAAMDEEQKRRIAEAPLSPKGGVSDAQVEVLESIARRASKMKAKELSDATQQEYILAEAKARSQEEAMRKVHQKQVDKAMDEEQRQRVGESEGKEKPAVSQELKKEIEHHSSK